MGTSIFGFARLRDSLSRLFGGFNVVSGIRLLDSSHIKTVDYLLYRILIVYMLVRGKNPTCFITPPCYNNFTLLGINTVCYTIHTNTVVVGQ